MGGLFAASTALRLSSVDAHHKERQTVVDTDTLKSPGPQLLNLVAFEHSLGAADVVWLGVVQEIGKAMQGGRTNDNRLIRWSHVATDLDPHYFTVYYAVAINLSAYSMNADASDELLERGRRHLPDAWQLPFMQGYNAYFIRADALSAAELWRDTALIPGSPRFVLSLSSRARYQTGDRVGAEAMLEEMLPYLSGPARDDANLRLKAFRSEPILAAYDHACLQFRERHGMVPDAPTLQREGYVDLPPKDLYGDPISLDSNCRARTKTITIREDEAKKNLGNPGAKPDYDRIMQGQ